MHPTYTPHTPGINAVYTPHTPPINAVYTPHTHRIHAASTPHTRRKLPAHTPHSPRIHPAHTPHTPRIHFTYNPHTHRWRECQVHSRRQHPHAPRKHTAHTPHTPRTDPACTPHTPRINAVYTEHTRRIHAASIPHTRRKHPANTPYTPRKHPAHTMQAPRTHPAYTPHKHRTHLAFTPSTSARTPQAPRTHSAHTPHRPRTHTAVTPHAPLCMLYSSLKIWILLTAFLGSVASKKTPPHILFIMVDDMGWNDVSYHGSDLILTPNLDALATNSVILRQYYSEAICTPARTALLTGKYPMRLGMHGMPLYNSEDRGIPTSERLLPSFLKERGYKTHLVGKWHVGMSRYQFLPTRRGYDTHLGLLGGFIDYYTYNKLETWPNRRELYGLDLVDKDVPQDDEDRYIVDVLTERAIQIIQNHNDSSPMFLHLSHNAPHAANEGGLLQPLLPLSKKNKHIAHPNRRLYAEMVTHLDLSIGRVVKALSEKGILKDTIIVFVSDNGAPTVGPFNNWGVNLPFRGIKQSPWEGAVRVPAFIWHPSLKPKVFDGLMHVTDWLPTLMAATGVDIKREIDGVNQWKSILKDAKPKRKEVLIAIEDSSSNVYGAYRAGDYKIIVGNVSGIFNGYYGDTFMTFRAPPPDYVSSLESSMVARVFESENMKIDYDAVLSMRNAGTVKQRDQKKDCQPCEPTPERGCLYNVKEDPSESHDLWSQETKITAVMWSRLKALWSMQLRRGPTALDDRADPSNFGYRWKAWLNDTEQ